MTDPQSGKIIVLNGASSAGKSTPARAVQAEIDEPFLCFSLDFFFFRDEVLPRRFSEGGAFAWEQMRPQIFEGYFRCLPALLSAGNNLVVDYIIESQQQWDRLSELLRPFDLFLVGVHCPLEELERRERARGDRRAGDAARDLLSVHTFTSYDLEVDSRQPVAENAHQIVQGWRTRSRGDRVSQP